MASDIIQNWAFAEQKTVADLDSHTHAYTPPLTSKNSSDFVHYKIQIQFQKKFPDIVYNVKKIDLQSVEWDVKPLLTHVVIKFTGVQNYTALS